ncbi:MAG: protein translocase subunit SecD [Planctomycetaceae bacterium]
MSQLLHGLLNLALQAPDAAAEVANAATKAAAETVETATEIVPAAQASGTSPFVFTLLTLFILVLPFVLAYVAAKALKVQEWTGRLAVVFFTLAVGASPFLTSLMKGERLDKRFRLGIDLAGGTNMVFQVKPEGKEVNDQVMDRMVGAVSQRINRSGTEEVTVRKVGRDRIEVIVPGEDPQTVDEIKRQITRLGSLEFFICADSTDQQIVRMANELDKSQTILEMDGEIVARWIPAFEKNGAPKLLDESVIRRSVQKTREVNGKMENYDTEEYLLLVEPPEESVTGKFLRSATPDFDQNGAIVVSFTFDQTGGYLFGQLTGRNAPKPGLPPRKLAIVLDKKVFSAPNINEQITNRGQISGGAGGFTRAEAEELSNVLNAGALEVPIDPKPLSEATVDPTLGADVRNKGVNATLISGLAVVIFMLAYYRFSGIVAVVSLMLNLLLTVAAMVAINATFTLPGIAGIVLTIGMAVDANVLIYERMREEIAKGSSIRMAIQNGFEKAFITIFDANITTLLTAVILFAIGTDQIKGFAVTLFLGLAISMYTVLFVGRLMFDIAEKRRWLKKLNMSQLIGETRIDFLKHRVMWCTISLVVIGVGLIAFFIRGDKNYDIDFTGGTMVSFQTTEPQKTDDVSAALKPQFKDEFTLERLTLGTDSQEGIGNYFRLRSTEKDDHSPSDTEAAGKKSAEQRVRDMVYESFKDHPSIKLRMVSLEFSEIAPVVIADGDESAQAISRMRFKGGSASDLTFSEEVASGTVNDMLAGTLGAIKKEDGSNKYSVTEGLFGLEGTEGSGTTVGERSVRKFNKLTVRVSPDVAADDLKTALTSMQSTLASTPLFDEVNTFASAVASEMKESAVIAILLSIVAISAYIWFRFQNVVFGLAAVVALVHDVLVSLGFVAMASWVSGTPIGDLFLIDDFRINLPMIAAFLTLVGYSLNDTIVMFDRIREVRGKNPAITVSMVNLSLNQTLGRTILTATTVFIVVFILYAFGGAGIHGFAWCLLVGCIAGTYSSIYIASPILIWALNKVHGTVKA